MTAAELCVELQAAVDEADVVGAALLIGDVERAAGVVFDVAIRLTALLRQMPVAQAKPPAVSVEFPLEGSPHVVVSGGIGEGDHARLVKWISSDEELADLVERALALKGRRAGAR